MNKKLTFEGRIAQFGKQKNKNLKLT